MSDSVRPHKRQPIRLPRPRDSPGTNTGVGCHFLLQCMKVKSEREVAQSCPTLNMDCSPPGSSVRGIFQARVLEWIAISFSGGSSWPRNLTRVSCIAGTCFTVRATREAIFYVSYNLKSRFLIRSYRIASQKWDGWINRYFQISNQKDSSIHFRKT